MRKLNELENEMATRLGKCCEASFDLVICHTKVMESLPDGTERQQLEYTLASLRDELGSQEAFLTRLLNDIRWARKHYDNKLAGF